MTKQDHWKDLTSSEIKTLWMLTKKPTQFAEMLIAKFKEKNECESSDGSSQS